MVTSPTNSILFGFGANVIVTDESGLCPVVASVAVAVGGSCVFVGASVGVLVSVGILNAVNVNFDSTVSAACVKIAFASKVGSTGALG